MIQGAAKPYLDPFLLTEKVFQGHVKQLALICGFRVYHTHDSRRSDAGFPDLVMIRRGRLIVAELKREKGKTTPDQEAWIEAFRETGAETYVWRPADWLEIVRVIGGEIGRSKAVV